MLRTTDYVLSFSIVSQELKDGGLRKYHDVGSTSKQLFMSIAVGLGPKGRYDCTRGIIDFV